MVMAVATFGLMAAMMSCVALLVYEPLRTRVTGYLNKKTSWATRELDAMFMEVTPKRLELSFVIGPLVGALAGGIVLRSLVGVGGGAIAGLVIPQGYITQMKAKRRKKFQAQLVDMLMLMSSSLKAGLSILQAFEVVVEELPPPMSQEIGLVLKENKMGMPLQETLMRLKRRMPSDDLNLIVTAVLVARETGGDVTQIFARLVDTLRERKKLQERVKTLTIQSRIQGIIMGVLPVAFAMLVYSFNPHFFDPLFHDALGRILLMAAIVLEVIGAFLIWFFGRVPT